MFVAVTAPLNAIFRDVSQQITPPARAYCAVMRLISPIQSVGADASDALGAYSLLASLPEEEKLA